MVKELTKERESFSYASEKLPTGHSAPIQVNEPFSLDPYQSTVLSCRDYPPTWHAAKALFIDPEPEIRYATKEQEKQKKVSLLKRLSIANLKIEMLSFFEKVKDTISSVKDRVWNFFGWETAVKKGEAPNTFQTRSRKAETGKDKIVPIKESQPMEDLENLPAGEGAPVRNIENERLKEIEDLSINYDFEIEKGDADNIKAMMEMACKIAILVGMLCNRHHKNEIKDYLKHLQANVIQRKKTFEGSRKYLYISVGLQFAAAGFSIAGLLGAAPKIGPIIGNFKNLTQPASSVGDALGKLDSVEQDKKSAERTVYDFEKETLTEWKGAGKESVDKNHQLLQDMKAAWRNAEQSRTDAAKRAASAG